jgi:hypothetical protein
VSSQMLDLLVQIFDGVNLQLKENAHPIGLILVGDFAQLPPIPERVTGEAGRARSKPATPWAFEAACWDRFEKNTTRLTKIWRQADLRFLSALNAARRGDGSSCISHLQSSGCEFHTSNDMDFDGTTILAENKHVDAFNSEAMKKVRGRDMFLPTRRWGRDRGEWKNIPSPEIKIRENAYVMLLANQPSGTRGQFNYVNGDCGHVRGIEMRGKGIPPYILVELVRTGGVVKVPPIVRSVSFKDKPTGFVGEQQILGAGEYYPAPHHNKSDKRYVAGQIQYYPIRLGYATTAHKSQGLSLAILQPRNGLHLPLPLSISRRPETGRTAGAGGGCVRLRSEGGSLAMSRSTSKPIGYDVLGSYGSVSIGTVTCTHCRSSDTISFEFSDGQFLCFSDEQWAAMCTADKETE